MPSWSILGLILGGLFLALMVALLVFSYVRAQVLLTPLRKPLDKHPGQFGLTVEDLRIRSPRGELAAWYLPARNGCTLICCHGIHDNRSQWIEQVALLYRRSGYGALLFDFAGHGASGAGRVTYGPREVLDVRAVIAYLRARGDVDMGRIGILGYSLGAIAATLAAPTAPELRCLVSESGFADFPRDINMLFTRFTHLPAFPFANLIIFFGEHISGVRLTEIRPVAVIGQVSPRAVLIISDLEDELANEPYDGEHLYASAGEPRQLWQVVGAGHVRAFELFPDEWIQRVGSFLDEYLAAPPPSAAQLTSPVETTASGE
jgi:alpha/beta superfamily hydrolase